MNSVLWAYCRSSRVHIAGLLYFLIAGVLTQIPLLNYLGFEFSAFMTIPAALITGIMTLKFFDEHRIKPITKRTWLYIMGDYLLINFLLLLIPLGIISLNALVVKNCAYEKGLALYMLLPVITMIFSVSLALVIGSLFTHKKTLFVLSITGILCHILLVTYTKPQLFAYNLVLGFFPGITYDESIVDMPTLLLFREMTLLMSLLFFLLFVVGLGSWSPSRSLKDNLSDLRKTVQNNKIVWICLMTVLATVIYGFLFRSELGIEHTASDIQKQLGRRSESEHFIFYYDAGDFGMDEMIRLRSESEYHYSIVSDRIEANNGGKKIEVYLYPTAAVKQRLIGTANTNIAKPWKREIHLTSSSYGGSFRHELVHILAGDFGFPIIHASTRMGLNEGVAVAIDWETGLFTPHQYAAALMRENALGDVVDLFTVTGFAKQSGAMAYTVSGSFCRYLIDRFGMRRMKQAFANGNFVLAFNETAGSLVRDWTAFLKTVDTSQLPRETIQAYFFHQAIFYKECAREVAEKNQRAAAAIRVKDFTSAERQFSASYQDAPTAYALRGIMQSLIAQRKFTEAGTRYEQLPDQSLLRVNPSLLYLYADALYFQGNKDKALELYRTISDMKYSDSFIESSVLRRMMMVENIDPQMVYKIYYTGIDDSTRSTIIENELQMHSSSVALLYLQGSLADKMMEKEKALRSFRRVLNAASSPDLLYFTNTRIADIEYRMGRYERAKQSYWNAKNFELTPALKEYLDERIEICDAASVVN